MTLIFVPFINLDCSSSKDASSELSLIFKSIFFKVKSFDLKYGVEKISSYAPSRLKSPLMNVFSSITISLFRTLAIFGFKFKLKLMSVKKSLSLGLKLLYLSKK